MSETFYITDSLAADVPDAHPGRLGLIAIDPEGRHVVSITARHIAGESGELLIGGDKRAQVSSYRIPQRFKEIGQSGVMYKPAECLLAFAKFKKGRFKGTYRTGMHSQSEFHLKQPVMPTYNLLLNEVLLHTQGSEPKTVNVASIVNINAAVDQAAFLASIIS